MNDKRILTMQDISCVGQCSMTVTLPVLSACGMETCVLPTAVLSTHTGGFWKPAVTHLDGALEGIWRHWKESGIGFDGVHIGYLGSVAAISAAETILDELLVPGGVAVVDPAMADHGRLYTGFDRKYVALMRQLCAKADVIVPNLTEAAMLAGVPYQETWDEGYLDEILRKLPDTRVILTGIGSREGETGAVLWDGNQKRYYVHQKFGQDRSGTGDLFAAAFTGAWMQGKEMFEAVRIAADFTGKCVENTVNRPTHWYGIRFEPVLPDLIAALR